MAQIRPLRALHYAADDLQNAVAPPYDVIDDDLRRDLLGRSPHNVVAIDLPAGRRPVRHGGAHVPGVAGRRRPHPRRQARPLGPDPGVHGPGRAEADADRLLRRGQGRGVRPREDPPPRAHAPRPEGGSPPSHARDEREPVSDLQPLLRPRRSGARGARQDRRARASRGRPSPTTTARSTGCGASRTRTSSPTSRPPSARPSCSSPTATTATRPRACTRRRRRPTERSGCS